MKKLFTFPNDFKIREDEVKNSLNGEITVQKFSYGHDMANRTSIINHLIHKYKLKDYLEIGTREGHNFDNIIARNKIGVDPKPQNYFNNIIIKTSDNFFITNNIKFDLIFIDGLHLENQVDKDLSNSLNFLKKDGFVIMHDCNPPTEFHQREIYEVNGKFPAWNGTVWRSYVKNRMYNKNFNMSCVNCDWGVGVIQVGNQKLFKAEKNLNYTFLKNNRRKLLNLVSVKDFIKKFN